jgi:hypothetical protein
MIDLGQYDAIKKPIQSATRDFRVTDVSGNLVKGDLTQSEAVRIVVQSDADLYVRKAK